MCVCLFFCHVINVVWSISVLCCFVMCAWHCIEKVCVQMCWVLEIYYLPLGRTYIWPMRTNTPGCLGALAPWANLNLISGIEIILFWDAISIKVMKVCRLLETLFKVRGFSRAVYTWETLDSKYCSPSLLDYQEAFFRISVASLESEKQTKQTKFKNNNFYFKKPNKTKQTDEEWPKHHSD